jgi:hypothetical protein
MVPLPGHGPDYLVHLFGVFVVVIDFEAGDLASKLGFDDGYRYLPPICDM